MPFDGSEGGKIDKAKAALLTAEYRKGNQNRTMAHYFGKNIINDILCQEGCVGIRMYYGLEESGQQQLLLVGVTADENDMVEGIIGDLSYPCPPGCSKPSALTQ